MSWRDLSLRGKMKILMAISLKHTNQRAFTIVELIVTIAVIGILASLAVVGYGSYRTNVAVTEVKHDLNGVQAAMDSGLSFDNQFPLGIPRGFKSSPGVELSYGQGTKTSYCITATSKARPGVSYSLVGSVGKHEVKEGSCPGDAPGSSESVIAVRSTYAGGTSSVVIGKTDGHPYSVGFNNNGELATGDRNPRYVYTKMIGLPAGLTAVDVDAGYRDICVLASDGNIYVSSASTFNLAPVARPDGVKYVSTMTRYHNNSCTGLGDDGKVYEYNATATPVDIKLPAGEKITGYKFTQYGNGPSAQLQSGKLYIDGSRDQYNGVTISGEWTGTGTVMSLPGSVKIRSYYPGRGHASGTLAVGDNGRLYSVGCIGAASCRSTFQPVAITLPGNARVVDVAPNTPGDVSNPYVVAGNGRVYRLDLNAESAAEVAGLPAAEKAVSLHSPASGGIANILLVQTDSGSLYGLGNNNFGSTLADGPAGVSDSGFDYLLLREVHLPTARVKQQEAR